MSEKQGDKCIVETSMRLGFDMQQRTSINRVRIALKVILISELVVLNNNVIKSWYGERLEDVQSISTLHWPNSVPNKRDIIIWNKRIRRIITSDGSLNTPFFLRNSVAKHRRSTAFLSGDKSLTKLVHNGNNLFYKWTRLNNKNFQLE